MASSMRVSVLSRSLPMRQTSTGTAVSSLRDRDNGLTSSASSVRSAVRTSSESYASAMSGNTIGGSGMRSNGGMSPAKMIVKETRASGRTIKLKDRPDSKMTASAAASVQPSILEPEMLEEDGDEDQMEDEEGDGEGEDEEENDEYDGESGNGDELPTTAQSIKKVLITRASLASVTSRSTLSSLAGSGSGSSVSARPVSSASSVRSQTTVRRSAGSSVGSSRLNVTPTKSPVSRPTPRTHRISTTSTTRPTSSLSSATDSTATYRTASTGGLTTTRSRRTSGASTVSIRTPGGGDRRTNPNSPVGERTRRISGASVSSVASNAGSLKTTRANKTASTGKKLVGSGSATSPAPTTAPKKLAPTTIAGVSRPGSIHSSVSGGSTSTASNSTSKKVVRKTVPKKKSGDVDLNSSSLPSAEVTAKGLEVEEEEEELEKSIDKEKERMDVVEADNEVVKEEDQQAHVVDDIIVEDPVLPNTSSTIKPKDQPFIDPIPVTATASVGSEHKKSSSSTSTTSVVTLKRKESSDTIRTIKSSPSAPIVVDASLTKGPSDATKTIKSVPIVVDAPLTKQLPPTPSSHPPPPPPQQCQSPPLQHQSSTLKPPMALIDPNKVVIPQGATLDIGIPCIIASKRKRFKAYARYIGEVEGEVGAWVGVEVPMPFGDSWTSSGGDGGVGEKVHGDDRQWNDGSWGGIRYFEIGGMGGSEWDYGSATNEDRTSRRRRMEGGGGSASGSVIWGNSGGGKGDKGILKREGDQLSIASASEMRRKKFRSVSPAVSDMSGVETRGLFVRPQQVLYVVDAVGADL